MAMYYYASKLNEAASCSGCHRKTPQPQHLQQLSNPYFTGAGSQQPVGNLGARGSLMNGGGGPPEAARPPPPPPSPDNARPGPSGANVTVGAAAAALGLLNAGAVAGGGMVAGMVAPGAGGGPAVFVPQLDYRDGLVSSGTIDALIDLVKPGEDRPYVYAFILCSRIYIRPHELLLNLCRRHALFLQVEQDNVTEEYILTEMSTLVRILGEWTENFPYDFRDDRVMALVRNITQRCAQDEMLSLRDEMSLILQKLLDRLTALENYEDTLIEIPFVFTIDKVAPNDITGTGLSPGELAKQLTLIELHQLSFIGPEEFIQAFIHSSSNKDVRQHESKKTKNLEVYGKWFNRLNYLVATDILKCPKTKGRARILEHWVMCARECFNLGNFNSLMAIVGALNMVCIARLKKTWARCTNVVEQLPPLERCMEPSSNHARYRSALSAANYSRSPAVPCFSITCRDLHFINQTAPCRINGNHLNMDKCRALARQISEHLARALVDTGIARDDVTWEYLLKTPVLSENAMEKASFEREPPNDHSEKDRYKAIRHHR